jgi:acyl carrier protein
VLACDAAERPALAAVLDRIAAGGPPLTAVVHAAGIADDGVLDRLDGARLASVLAAKATAAAHLDELTAGLDLDAFVFFSSAAGLLGSAGQGNYAAANAFLDALAQHRNGLGRPATSVAWGPWAGGGLAQAGAAVRARVRRGALPAMDPALAVEALGQAAAGPDAVLAVMDVDWARFAAAPGVGQAPFLRDLPEVRELSPGQDAGDDAGPDLAGRLAGLPRAGQARLLADLVRAQAAAVLGYSSADEVPAGRAFSELGIDSLTAVELRNRLAAATMLRLPATLVFDFPTPSAIAGYLLAEIHQDEAGRPPVLAGLDQLESALADIPAGSDVCAEVTIRLQTLMANWMSAQASPAVNGIAGRLKSATADEVLSFIDQELGVS